MSYHYQKERRAEKSQDFGAEDTGVPDESQALVWAPGGFHPDPEMQISEYYKLKDLCVTDLPYPNLPETQEELDNLIKMGTLLDAIHDNIGSYIIASVYRSQANQDYLRKSSSMAVAKSYHSMGLGADLTPTNGMNTTEFAQALYQNPITNVLLGQIVDKGDGGQTSVHISLPTSKFPEATPMRVGADHQYYRLKPDEIGKWLSSQLSDIAEPGDGELVSEEEMNDDSLQIPWKLVGGVAVAGLGLWFLKARR